MNTLILILLGIATGLLVSKSGYKKYWDITTGVLGALAVNSIMLTENIAYSPYALLEIMMWTTAIIYIGRLFQNSPQN
jgi:hypothetical protein